MYQPAKAVAARFLFSRVPEYLLDEVDSDHERSVYRFRCGCVALRRVQIGVV